MRARSSRNSKNFRNNGAIIRLGAAFAASRPGVEDRLAQIAPRGRLKKGFDAKNATDSPHISRSRPGSLRDERRSREMTREVLQDRLPREAANRRLRHRAHFAKRPFRDWRSAREWPSCARARRRSVARPRAQSSYASTRERALALSSTEANRLAETARRCGRKALDSWRFRYRASQARPTSRARFPETRRLCRSPPDSRTPRRRRAAHAPSVRAPRWCCRNRQAQDYSRCGRFPLDFPRAPPRKRTDNAHS